MTHDIDNLKKKHTVNVEETKNHLQRQTRTITRKLVSSQIIQERDNDISLDFCARV